jgi:SnoaL-like domain
VYSFGPFREPLLGLDAIVAGWTSGARQADITWSCRTLAETGDRGIAHWTVSFRSESGELNELDGILVCDFASDGRCSLHREWYDRRESTV